VIFVGSRRRPVIHGEFVHAIELNPSSIGQQLVEFNVCDGNAAVIIELWRSAQSPSA
jgi:hypothetical protein